ncbi:MAG: FAD:protein FMN transferase [bacterium]|nr:FAD:protein FMN transferase [bacterium]
MRRFSKTIAILLIVLLLLAVALASELRRPKLTYEPIARTDFILNTFVTITLYEYPDAALLDSAIDLCREYETVFSRTQEGSELYELNHRDERTGSFAVSDDMRDLLASALHYCEVSDGAFDITVAPIVDLWDFTASQPSLPDSQALADAAAKVDWRMLKLSQNTLTFLSEDTEIDLGAIAKGFIADRLKDYLKEEGVTRGIINLGGNVLCIGDKQENTPFSIGLQKPFAQRSETIALLNVSDRSLVSSGVYERHFILDGKNYHHILNPKTGMPYDNGLTSVTILSEHSVDGDGLSTVCFSLGLQKGLALINSLEDTYAYFITNDYEIYYSDGAEAFLQGGTS